MRILVRVYRILLFKVFYPGLIYLACFVVLTWPMAMTFASEMWMGQQDGLQNWWNLWWVRRALLQEQVSVWYTRMLHYPEGVSLYGHPVNITGGVIALVLAMFVGELIAYNILVLLGFVLGGLVMYWLVCELTEHRLGAIVAGFAYAFSNFHIVQVQEHLEMASVQWLPLFVWLWIRLVKKPTILRALLTAGALLLNTLTAYYYLLYAMLFMFGYVLFSLRKMLSDIMRDRRVFLVWMVFFGVALLTTGRVVKQVIHQQAVDPLMGRHLPEEYSLDLAALVVPGKFVKVQELTGKRWKDFNGVSEESSGYIRWGAIGLVAAAMLTIKKQRVGWWIFMWVVFTVLSFGPRLFIRGESVTGDVLPYDWLDRGILAASGLPMRMQAGAYLSAAVLVGYGVAGWARQKKVRWALWILVLLLVIESVPTDLQQTKLITLDHALVLASASEKGAVVDLAQSPQWSMYAQTIHGRPLIGGYLARVPETTNEWWRVKLAAIDASDWAKLCKQFGVAYVIGRTGGQNVWLPEQIVFDNGIVQVYGLRDEGVCMN